MSFIAFDCETVFDEKEYSVSKVGNWNYFHDPRFEMHTVSVCDGTESWAGKTADFNWHSLDGKHVVAHNAGFDMGAVEREIELGRAPEINISRWSCTANMSAALCHRRSLEAAAGFLLGEQVDKSVRAAMSGKKWANMEADGTLAASLEYARRDAYLCWRLWNEYNARWSPFEQRIADHTLKMARRGFPIDRQAITTAKEVLQHALRKCESKLPWIAEGRAPTSPIAIAQKCRDVGIPGPPVKSHDGGEEAFEAWEAAFSPKYEWIAEVARRRSISKVIDSVESMEARASADDVLRYELLYFGAATGRPTSRGYNVLNMRKVPVYFDAEFNWLEPDDEGAGPPETAHTIDPRGWLVPPKGHLLGIVDSAQIEPRIAHWFAGNTKFLEKIKAGFPIYEAFARSVGWYSDPAVLKHNKAASETYKTAKASVIGGGYGIGPKKFVTTALKLAGLRINLEQAEDIIYNQFRPSVPEIADRETGIWAKLTRDFEACVGGDFCMTLPTGRKMWYRNVRRDRKVSKDPKTGLPVARWVTTAEFFNEKTQKIQREALWGGALLENWCQAFAREVFMHQTLEVEDRLGFPVLLHVYDENVSAIPADQAQEALEAMIEVHSKTPPFAEGLPLFAEGQIADRYTK